jgi:hypothetical protein
MNKEEIADRIVELTADVDGHHFQQHPEELAGMIELLLTDPPKRYLEIGAGSGNVARVLDNFFDFDIVRLIDDGKHYSGRLEQIPKAIEWIGDSTSSEAVDTIDQWGQRFDLILIDGGHAYENVKSDTYLTLRCADDPCWIAFHDARHGEVRVWLAKLQAGRIDGLTHVQLFGRQSDGKKNLSVFRWQR